MADTRLKVGIAGAGLMGHWHAKFLQNSNADLVAVFDKNPEKSRKLCAGFKNAPSMVVSMEDMQARFEPDVVHICTPLESHFDIAMQALQSGSHVVVEKPLTSTAPETRQLIELANQRGLTICPVHQMAFQRGVQHTQSALSGLGDILEMRFTSCSAGGTGVEGDGLNAIVQEIVSHPLSIMQALKPDISLNSDSWQGINPRPGDLQLIGIADGIAVDISISMNARPTRCEMELFCSEGRVYLNLFHGYCVVEKGKVSRLQKLLQPFKYSAKEFLLAGNNAVRRAMGGELAYPGLNRFLDEFYRSLGSSAASPVSPDHALEVAIARDELSKWFLPDRTTDD